MDPGRRALIEGRAPRSIISPRHDPNARISKAQIKSAPTPSHKYLTQDELDERFVADEDKFVLKQAKKKADIRVREHRASPIDYLAFNLRFVDSDRDILEDDDADLDLEIPSPEEVVAGLQEKDLAVLVQEIISYDTLETNLVNHEYWSALTALSNERLAKLRAQGPEGRAVNAVASDIDKLMAPKSYEQLVAMEKHIQAKLQSGEPVDTDYWEGVLASLYVWKAKARLGKITQKIRETRLQQLETRRSGKAKDVLAGAAAPVADRANSTRHEEPTSGTAITRALAAAAPVGSASAAKPPGTQRFDLTASEDFSQATRALYEREVARGLGDNEEIFTAEEAVPSSAAKPQWADKYRPRKPRYFNRVQMGYEWNKYNQTHYDHDHPPPKVVQGYRFNIFYPDLIDKTKTPTFKIIREDGRRRGESFAPAGEEDTCLIRFVAGPPYEDIAFRIVDREWDYSAKRDRGFRSSFDKVSCHPQQPATVVQESLRH
jgi:hypothetical protein